MSIVSDYFSRSEFSCKCGCDTSGVDVELLNVLEDLRIYFDSPVEITSGNRCIEHNKKIGGSKRSKHTKGIAADVKVKGIPSKEVYTYLDSIYPDTYGIGLYNSWVHIDMRDRRARW